MPNPSANLMIAVCHPVVCLRLTGRASFTTSVPFKTVVTQMRQRGSTRFVLDLTECLAMDSTFLGVLAGLAQHWIEAPEPRAQLELVNANQRIADMLDNLGVLHLFKLVGHTHRVDGQFEAVPASTLTKTEMAQVCLEAHQTLMDLNPANIPKFKDVARFLAENVRQGEGN